MIERIGGILLLASLAASCPLQAGPLSDLEARGKALYFFGMGGNGKPVKARIGEESTLVDGDAVPCAGCHGEDGRGKPEGDVVPPDVSWSNLSKPYGHRHGSYRSHPAIDERNLATLLAAGVDPGGNRMDSAMPRFALGEADRKALVAYLKHLDLAQAPGTGPDTLHLGLVLPLSGAEAPLGRDMQAMLVAYFDALNQRGGIFSRKFILETVDSGAGAQGALERLRRLVETEQVFAVLAAYAPGFEPELNDLLERLEVPSVGAIADFPRGDDPNAFYLFPGLEGRARALLEQATGSVPRIALVYPDQEAYRRLAERLDSVIAAKGWARPQRLAYPAEQGVSSAATAQPEIRNADTVLFLGASATLEAWALAEAESGWRPAVWFASAAAVPGSFELPPPWSARLSLALPFSLDSAAPQAMAELRQWQREAGVGDRSLYPEAYAQAAAGLLVDALKHCGRDVGRSQLVGALESASRFEEGVIGDLSFSPSRRFGHEGVSIVSRDPAAKEFRQKGPMQALVGSGH